MEGPIGFHGLIASFEFGSLNLPIEIKLSLVGVYLYLIQTLLQVGYLPDQIPLPTPILFNQLYILLVVTLPVSQLLLEMVGHLRLPPQLFTLSTIGIDSLLQFADLILVHVALSIKIHL